MRVSVLRLEVCPGHLGQDASSRRAVTNGLERGEGLPIDFEGLIDITPTGRESGEATQRDARAFPVADPVADRGSCGVKVAALAVAGSRGVASGRSRCRRCAMTALHHRVCRCSTDQQDLTAQRDGLAALGVVG